jgi:hypothetical protein
LFLKKRVNCKLDFVFHEILDVMEGAEAANAKMHLAILAPQGPARNSKPDAQRCNWHLDLGFLSGAGRCFKSVRKRIAREPPIASDESENRGVTNHGSD